MANHQHTFNNSNKNKNCPVCGDRVPAFRSSDTNYICHNCGFAQNINISLSETLANPLQVILLTFLIGLMGWMAFSFLVKHYYPLSYEQQKIECPVEAETSCQYVGQKKNANWLLV